MCTLCFGGRGCQKVYGLYTHGNVDIYGRPLNDFHGWHKYFWSVLNIVFIITISQWKSMKNV